MSLLHFSFSFFRKSKLNSFRFPFAQFGKKFQDFISTLSSLSVPPSSMVPNSPKHSEILLRLKTTTRSLPSSLPLSTDSGLPRRRSFESHSITLPEESRPRTLTLETQSTARNRNSMLQYFSTFFTQVANLPGRL